MIRTLTLAAVAAASFAAPAAAGSVRIATAGKAPEQVRAEIRAAANTVCREATATASLPLEAMSACMTATVRRAEVQLRAIELARDRAQQVATR